MNSRLAGVAVITLAFVAACAALFGTAADTGSDDDSDQPALTDGDYPDTFPCSDRDTLPTDETFLETLTNAADIVHIFTEYESDDNLAAVCGLSSLDNALEGGESGWNPEDSTLAACNDFSESVSFFADSDNYSPGICRSSFGYDSDSASGFPRGGIYRVDFCVGTDPDDEDAEQNFYNVRMRLSISGKDVNKTWAAVGVDDDEVTLSLHDSAGTEITTMEEAKKLITDFPSTGTTFTIRSGEGGATTHLSVIIQVICIKSVGACPKLDDECD